MPYSKNKCYNSEIHFLSELTQYGIFKPNVSFIFVLSSTEYAGRFTLEGNSLLWHGSISHAVLPESSAIFMAKSYQLQTPSLE